MMATDTAAARAVEIAAASFSFQIAIRYGLIKAGVIDVEAMRTSQQELLDGLSTQEKKGAYGLMLSQVIAYLQTARKH